jgi:hypothetical protein
MTQVNDNLVLIVGKSSNGKSASLMGLKNPEGVMYLNCEAGKKLPFPAKFMKGKDGKAGLVITDPLQIMEAFEAAESMPHIHTIVIDTLTYLLDMYESLYVLNSTNTMKAWGDFAQYFKNLMQQYVAKSSKNVVFLAHTTETMNDSDKRVSLKTIKDYKNDLLVITPQEEALGFKYVYQTQVTKETVHERLRGPMGLFSHQETFIDNNLQLVLDRLHQYYA